MKKQLLLYFFATLCTNLFSQEIIENPKYGSYYKKYTEITKIELTDNETILHITSKNKEKNWIKVPRTIYISDENSNKKKFVIKSEGISLDTKTTLNNQNEISYKLFFPPLDKSSNVIDLKIEKEANGSWKGQPRGSITLAYRVEIRPIEKVDSQFSNMSLDNGFIKAKQENKNVLLFFTAPWCGPCNWMKKIIHTDESVRTIIKTNYIALEINRDTQKGTKLAKQYNNSGIPFYVLLTPENKIIKTQTGSRKKDVFVEFLTPEETIIPKELEKPKTKTKEIDPGLGLRLGAVKNNIGNSSLNSRTGFTADLFYSKEIDNRFLFRTGIGFNSKGYEDFSINYLRIPFDFGVKVLNGSLINTQGGIRAMVSPYYAYKLNKADKGLRNDDYGVRFGLSHYIGSHNELELELYYEHGIQDVFKYINGKQNNRGFGVSLLLSL
ncbi:MULTISPECIES: thioredoxin family protein [Winogradskyella]|uniref:thioredoxin family protein n=1 Tax=Winogradskyella TaxID=286104 RepID=UPI0015C70255|nr:MULTISPECIES: thioredoxin family protein [Winogradskyella]QXP78708.1 thioredoxin family protein [Winogradskyella sp. HaHa_3_26]